VVWARKQKQNQRRVSVEVVALCVGVFVAGSEEESGIRCLPAGSSQLYTLFISPMTLVSFFVAEYKKKFNSPPTCAIDTGTNRAERKGNFPTIS
jgi:hypothetical protein